MFVLVHCKKGKAVATELYALRGMFVKIFMLSIHAMLNLRIMCDYVDYTQQILWKPAAGICRPRVQKHEA